MVNTSDTYKKAIKEYGREFRTECILGDTVVDDSNLIKVNIEDTFNSSNDELKMGCAISNKATISLFNVGKIAYESEPIHIKKGLVLPDKSIEWVNMGTFYPAKVESDNDYKTIKIEAYDFMSKLNEPYNPRVSLPTTDTAIIKDICSHYNIEFVGETLGCKIDKMYEATERETLGYMAGLQGLNAHMTRDNKLDFKWYVMSRKYKELENLTWAEAEKITWVELSRRENG